MKKVEGRHNRRLSKKFIDLKIDDEVYVVYNMSSTGFGFFVDDPNLFRVGDILSPIVFKFNGKKESVTGKVVHITSLVKLTTKDEDVYLVGVQFLFSEEDRNYYLEQFKILMEFI